MKFSKIKLQMLKEQDFNYDSKKISSAIDIVEYINKYEQLEKATEEHTILICLNCKNQIIAYTEVAKGGINYCNLDFKTIFKSILLCNANRFILVHNHPSGVAEASRGDINVTKRIKEMSDLMEIEFLDHVIIADDDYVSCMVRN